MPTVSFKSDDSFKRTLELLARKKGINVSAYIKLVLTQEVDEELSTITENGLTVAEELAILDADENEEISGPYTTSASLMRALRR